MAHRIAHIVRVPVRNVKEVFKTLTRHGETCTLDLFVDNLLEVAKPATEQSVMKILAQILDANTMIKSQEDFNLGVSQKQMNQIDAHANAHNTALEALETANKAKL